eukprot:10220231-Prorocentrum_lima.AAC.1
MTSSLVGSEMCIRDRLRPHVMLWIGLLRKNKLRGGSPNRALKLKLQTCSVSYTHLTLPTICSV